MEEEGHVYQSGGGGNKGVRTFWKEYRECMRSIQSTCLRGEYRGRYGAGRRSRKPEHRGSGGIGEGARDGRGDGMTYGTFWGGRIGEEGGTERWGRHNGDGN